jgi:uncharacterized protein (DUF2267 family)
MKIPNISNIPKIPIPAPLRVAVLRRAIWDTLRTRLSYDEANAVKAEAEARVEAVLLDLMQPQSTPQPQTKKRTKIVTTISDVEGKP